MMAGATVLLFCALAVFTAISAGIVEEVEKSQVKTNEIITNEENLLMTLLYGIDPKNQNWTDGSVRKEVVTWTSSQSKEDNDLYDLLIKKLLMADKRSDAAGRTAEDGVRNTTSVLDMLSETSHWKPKHVKDERFLRKKVVTVEDWEYPNQNITDYDT